MSLKMGGLGYSTRHVCQEEKNASGSTSVLVVSKDNHRRHRLVKNMGCGNTPSEMSVFVSSAKEYIANTKGAFLPGLLEVESEIEGFFCNLGNTSIQVIGPELVFRSLCDRIGDPKSPLGVKTGQELTKGMYALSYRLPK